VGFLDHATNNIILDAVLTDKGRELLANGVGNFSIAKFAFADDEVNYNFIEEFGRTVGKEKIEKNTPVLEACTTGYLGVKYRNLSLNNNALSILPTINLETTLQNNEVTLFRGGVGGGGSAQVTIAQNAPAGTVIDVDNTDYSFRVTVDNLFLAIRGAVPDTVDNYNIATYTIPANSAIDEANLSKMTFTLVAKQVGKDVFDSFSYTASGVGVVSRVITVSGYNSGQFVSFNANVY
jgi:hypothetical protein